jgi:coniferyl-aldehyde dehydrogenase
MMDSNATASATSSADAFDTDAAIATHAAFDLDARRIEMRSAWLKQVPGYTQRRDDLEKLLACVRAHQTQLSDAVSADFGRRSRHETLLADVMMVQDDIKHTLRNLRRWMKAKSAAVDYKAWPARAEIQQKPLGVVGILSPWNYPIQLALNPLVAAIAAGNHVMLKPSEHTPRTSALMARMLASVFPAERVSVVLGGADVAAKFSELAFDHLFYTGSTAVGRLVMAAAAKHLTPVTLELGGKSPCVIAPDYPMAKAVARIAAMKYLNAGQTCIAPDYVLVEKGQRTAFVDAFRSVLLEAYPNIADNPDYTSIVNDRQYQRLQRYLDDAQSKGAEVISICAGEQPNPASRVLPPTLVLDARDDMLVMQDEIFGPILPVLEYSDLNEVAERINAGERPLAYYQFDQQSARVDRMLEKITAGGVTINDCALHITQHDLPFGGVGASGMGHYHGHAGFLTFTKQMPVFKQGFWSAFWLLKPPYKQLADRMTKWLLG